MSLHDQITQLSADLDEANTKAEAQAEKTDKILTEVQGAAASIATLQQTIVDLEEQIANLGGVTPEVMAAIQAKMNSLKTGMQAVSDKLQLVDDANPDATPE